MKIFAKKGVLGVRKVSDRPRLEQIPFNLKTEGMRQKQIDYQTKEERELKEVREFKALQLDK